MTKVRYNAYAMQGFDFTSKKYIFAVLLLVLILLSFFLRFYKLTEFPPSLYQDETAIGYNAYLILEKGVDEYGKSFPVYFKSFGDYKLPVYIYTTAVFMKIFGYGEFAVRAPSALAGSLSVILLFILLRRLTKDNGLAFTASFLLAINPWHLQFSRAGFEVNLALFFALLGTTFFIVGIEEKKYLLIPAALSFALSLYSYNVTRLLIPLFIILLVALYWPKLRKISFAYLTFLNIFMLVLLLPFLQTLFMSSGVYSAKTNLISSTDILVKNVEMRSYLESLPGWYTKLFYNNYIAIFLQYIQNIANIISGSFFFTQGTPHPNQGIGNVGTFYLFELPFFVLGIIIFFTKKIHSLRVFFWWLIVTVLTLALSKDVPHATRGYFLVIPIIVFTAQGILFFLEYLKHMHIYPLLKNALVGLTLLFAAYTIQFYFLSYYFRYPIVQADAWRTAEKQLSLYLRDTHQKYNRVIIENGDGTGFFYTSLLFYSKYDPDEFLTTAKRGEVGLLTVVQSFGNYEVRPIKWEKDILSPNTLLITNDPTKVNASAIIKTVKNPLKHIVLSENYTIVQAPLEETKFAVVETDKLDQKTRDKYLLSQ